MAHPHCHTEPSRRIRNLSDFTGRADEDNHSPRAIVKMEKPYCTWGGASCPHPSYSAARNVVLWAIITVTYPLATAVRTELVEVRTFAACDELSRAFDRLRRELSRTAHHERLGKRHRNLCHAVLSPPSALLSRLAALNS